ncbi:hypothetical protein EJC51_11735 [Streptomyces aquilus]|uniref:Low molecular weight antigen MTB12-like C-terminal domain-containing protein n=2 Tax=Streptomyces aquilus TaxID=2548456 RepID=A0A3S9HX84_9ACTN|nr:hypothetical protein EJC51_11735 [Streptomyces aquilus]
MVSQMVLGSDRTWGNGSRGLVAVVFVLAASLTACSDDSGGGSESPPPTPTPETTTSAPASPSVSGPADKATAEKEVKRNWQKFFDPKTSTKDKQAVLENGDKMGPVLAAFSGDDRGGQVKAQVTKVQFTSPTDATVTYTLLLNGATALPDASGKAVEQDGTWKVSVTTLCALVQLSGNASASALPGC